MFVPSSSKVNYVDSKNLSGGGNKRKFSDSNPSNNSNNKQNKTCYNCGKKQHFKRECKNKKKQKKNDHKVPNKANMVEKNFDIVAMVSNLHISMISELNMTDAKSKSLDWWYDTGATVHVCNNKSHFKSLEDATFGQQVQMGNNGTAKVEGKGTVELEFASGKKLTLINVLYVPEIRKNLVSANLLCKKGVKAVIESNNLILSKGEVFVGKGYSCDGKYKLSINKIIINFAYIVESSSLWHYRLAHLNYRSLKFMSKHGLISYKDDHSAKCEICIQAKMTKKSFPKVNRNSQLLELAHSDICELNGILTRGGNIYFITFIDDCSRYTYVYLMRSKDETFNKFKCYKSVVENQMEKKIKILRSDRGGEYFPTKFILYCEENDIIYKKSAPYTSQQNGLAERKIGH
jgi:hypothetical protein